MITAVRKLTHEYPNTALFSLGFLMVVVPEGVSKAVFYGKVWIYQWKRPCPPILEKLVEFWWWLEHTTPYTALAISICVLGSILMLIAYVRWVRGGRRRNSSASDEGLSMECTD